MSYWSWIMEALIRRGNRADIDPRHVEGYLRQQFGTLDALSTDQLDRELGDIIQTIAADRTTAERVARSYGL
jgi:hypothetical protein